MKRLFLIPLLLCALLSVKAQVQFGYLSYRNVLLQMPEYIQVKQQMDTLRAKYNAEAVRGEEEFQKKYIDFLQGQRDFPQTILQKRQAELLNLMNKGVEFRIQAQTLLKQAEEEMMVEVNKRLNRAILEVGINLGFGYVLNTDDNACPYINPVIGVDVTQLVLQNLGLLPPVEEGTQPQLPVIPAPLPTVVPENNPDPVPAN